MDNLPSVSAFEIKKKLNNSQDRFYGKMSIPGVSSNESIVSKINKIFSKIHKLFSTKISNDFIRKGYNPYKYVVNFFSALILSKIKPRVQFLFHI